MSKMISKEENESVVHFKFKNPQTNGMYQFHANHQDGGFLNKDEQIQKYEFFDKKNDSLEEEENHFDFLSPTYNQNSKININPIDNELFNQSILEIKNGKSRDLFDCGKLKIGLRNDYNSQQQNEENKIKLNDGIFYSNKILYFFGSFFIFKF